MTAAIVLTAPDLAPLEARLAQLLRRAGDLRPLMDNIGTALESSTLQRFEDEEAPDGTPWVPSFRAREEGGTTLTLSTRLRNSTTHIAGSDRVEVGTNVIYAGVHQNGATIRPKSAAALRFKLPGGLGWRFARQVVIPARPFLGVSTEDQEEIEALVEEYFEESLQ